MDTNEFLAIVNAQTLLKTRTISWPIKRQMPCGKIFPRAEHPRSTGAKIARSRAYSARVNSDLSRQNDCSPVSFSNGVTGYMARTGYTGEVGFELILPRESTKGLWDLLKHSHHDLKLIGLGPEIRSEPKWGSASMVKTLTKT